MTGGGSDDARHDAVTRQHFDALADSEGIAQAVAALPALAVGQPDETENVNARVTSILNQSLLCASHPRLTIAGN